MQDVGPAEVERGREDERRGKGVVMYLVVVRADEKPREKEKVVWKPDGRPKRVDVIDAVRNERSGPDPSGND